MSDDSVNHPKHYGGPNDIYEPHKVLEEWLTPEQYIGYCRGSALTYQMRAGKKDGEPAERDLAKAAFYCNLEIDYRLRYAKGNVGQARAVRLGFKLFRAECNEVDEHDDDQG